MQENLPELRDIHLPDGVSFFPPAYGWWVILVALVGAFLLYELVLFVRSKSKKLYALRLLKNVQSDSVVGDAGKVSEVLRRVCVYKYREAAVLFDKEWIEFLNRHSKKKISPNAAVLLANAPYISKKSDRFSAQDVEDLRDFAKEWIGENL